jgi:hypothetical protein
MTEDLKKGEITVILSYLIVRGSLIAGISGILWLLIGSLLGEIRGGDADPSLTALLGLGIGSLGSALGILVSAIAASIQEYLKDRLNGPPPSP